MEDVFDKVFTMIIYICRKHLLKIVSLIYFMVSEINILTKFR